MNLNLNFTGKTLLKDWWKTVKENFDSIQTRFNAHSSSAVLDHPDKSVTTEKIANFAVKNVQLGDGSVSQSKIADNAVRSSHIMDGNVTRAKLNGEIMNQLIEFQNHIDNPSQEIADGAVTRTKLSADVRESVDKAFGLCVPQDLGYLNVSYQNDGATLSIRDDALEYYTVYHFDSSQYFDTIEDYDYTFIVYSLIDKENCVYAGESVNMVISPRVTDSFGYPVALIISRQKKPDDALSELSTNPVQNKVIYEALSKKQDWECNHSRFKNMDEALSAIADLQDRVMALEV